MSRCRRALAAAVLGAALCAAMAGGTAAHTRSLPSAPLGVLSKLPAWLAPGGQLLVSGRAPAGAALTLLVGTEIVARGTADAAGTFALAGRAGAVGRHRVVLQGGGESRDLGVLVVRPVVLDAVGDITFAGPVAGAIGAHGPRYPWLHVADELRHADIATGNLECVVSTRGEPVPAQDKPPPRLRGEPSSLRPAIRFAGIDLFTVANNHTLDYGTDAFADTLASVRSFGAAAVGGGDTLDAARAPVILSRGGLRIAFLGYDDEWPPFHAGPDQPGTAPADPALVAEDVRAARAQADLVVVWFHWGVQYTPEPTERQRDLANAALGAGASVVLGAHPHVLQGLWRGRSTLVAWSLGNFVFYLSRPESGKTGILQVRLGGQGVISSGLLPARIVLEQPRLLQASSR